MSTNELDTTREPDATAELDTTVVLQMIREDLESTGVCKASAENAHASSHERAEAVYRSVATLRDTLPPAGHKELAVCFEWARQGIARQTAGGLSPELEVLYAAYCYARDVMLEAAKKSGP